MNKVGCEKQDLREGDVGGPRARGDLAQGIIVKKFSDVLLYGGSLLVEQICPPKGVIWDSSKAKRIFLTLY